jgi:hypothetical protein
VTLVEAIRDPARKARVVAACAHLVEDEVARKPGLVGVAVRTGFKTVQALNARFVPRAVEVLLPEFAPAIDPHFAQARASGDVPRWFASHAGEVADSLLAVTDARAARADHGVLVKVYRSLRGRARDHVIEAVPGLARIVVEHVP